MALTERDARRLGGILRKRLWKVASEPGSRSTGRRAVLWDSAGGEDRLCSRRFHGMCRFPRNSALRENERCRDFLHNEGGTATRIALRTYVRRASFVPYHRKLRSYDTVTPRGMHTMCRRRQLRIGAQSEQIPHEWGL